MATTSIVGVVSLIGFLAIPLILVVVIYQAYKKNVKHAEERLNIEKQQTFNLQKQVNELNERVGKIENLLKEVD